MILVDLVTTKVAHSAVLNRSIKEGSTRLLKNGTVNNKSIDLRYPNNHFKHLNQVLTSSSPCLSVSIVVVELVAVDPGTREVLASRVAEAFVAVHAKLLIWEAVLCWFVLVKKRVLCFFCLYGSMKSDHECRE